MSLCNVENQAKICRITCGWKKSELPMEWVWLYWRDVHSPAISRRLGIYDYRHYQYDLVEEQLLRKINEVNYSCPINEQLMWTSDVRYENQDKLNLFDESPLGEAKTALLGDIELIVDKSTTYRAVNKNAFTFTDISEIKEPQGSYNNPAFKLFFRRKSNQIEFRKFLLSVAQEWAKKNGVIRLRLSLFDAPDMEKERKAGYPIKTHNASQQYHASIELVLNKFSTGKDLIEAKDITIFLENIKDIHTYPIKSLYTSIYNGKPTIVGLRGYPAYQAMTALNAANQKNSSLLKWMYGNIAQGFKD